MMLVANGHTDVECTDTENCSNEDQNSHLVIVISVLLGTAVLICIIRKCILPRRRTMVAEIPEDSAHVV